MQSISARKVMESPGAVAASSQLSEPSSAKPHPHENVDRLRNERQCRMPQRRHRGKQVLGARRVDRIAQRRIAFRVASGNQHVVHTGRGVGQIGQDGRSGDW